MKFLGLSTVQILIAAIKDLNKVNDELGRIHGVESKKREYLT
jgi:hypothetical protein